MVNVRGRAGPRLNVPCEGSHCQTTPSPVPALHISTRWKRVSTCENLRCCALTWGRWPGCLAPIREHWTWSRESLPLGPHQPRDVQVSSGLPHPTEGVNCLLPSWGLCTEAGLGECLVTDQFWGDHHKLLGGVMGNLSQICVNLTPSMPWARCLTSLSLSARNKP